MAPYPLPPVPKNPLSSVSVSLGDLEYYDVRSMGLTRQRPSDGLPVKPSTFDQTRGGGATSLLVRHRTPPSALLSLLMKGLSLYESRGIRYPLDLNAAVNAA